MFFPTAKPEESETVTLPIPAEVAPKGMVWSAGMLRVYCAAGTVVLRVVVPSAKARVPMERIIASTRRKDASFFISILLFII